MVVSADGQVLGRLATRVARVLMGKHKPSYTPNMLCGDKVIVIHASRIRLTGKKWQQKVYMRHTGYPGGQRTRRAEELLQRYPERLVEMAVRRMLPKSKMGRAQYRCLHVYAGREHPHGAHKPVAMEDLNL